MKELSIEEKAKRYDEAIEIAKEINNERQAQPFNVMTKVFPELAESENEKMVKFIKKQLFNIKKTITDNYELDTELTKAIDWLEKQGKNNMGISEATKKKLEDNLNKALEKETAESFNEFLDEQGKQNPVEWSEEDEKMINSIAIHLNATTCGFPEDRAFADKFMTWLKSLKDRVQPQPQQQWSRKDKAYLNIIIEDLKELYKKRKADPDSVLGKSQRDNIDWLKSPLSQKLSNAERNGKNWKPTEEQIKAVEEALSLAKNCGEDYSFDLRELLEQLKAL